MVRNRVPRTSKDLSFGGGLPAKNTLTPSGWTAWTQRALRRVFFADEITAILAVRVDA